MASLSDIFYEYNTRVKQIFEDGYKGIIIDDSKNNINVNEEDITSSKMPLFLLSTSLGKISHVNHLWSKDDYFDNHNAITTYGYHKEIVAINFSTSPYITLFPDLMEGLIEYYRTKYRYVILMWDFSYHHSLEGWEYENVFTFPEIVENLTDSKIVEEIFKKFSKVIEYFPYEMIKYAQIIYADDIESYRKFIRKVFELSKDKINKYPLSPLDLKILKDLIDLLPDRIRLENVFNLFKIPEFQDKIVTLVYTKNAVIKDKDGTVVKMSEIKNFLLQYMVKYHKLPVIDLSKINIDKDMNLTSEEEYFLLGSLAYSYKPELTIFHVLAYFVHAKIWYYAYQTEFVKKILKTLINSSNIIPNEIKEDLFEVLISGDKPKIFNRKIKKLIKNINKSDISEEQKKILLAIVERNSRSTDKMHSIFSQSVTYIKSGFMLSYGLTLPPLLNYVFVKEGLDKKINCDLDKFNSITNLNVFALHRISEKKEERIMQSFLNVITNLYENNGSVSEKIIDTFIGKLLLLNDDDIIFWIDGIQKFADARFKKVFFNKMFKYISYVGFIVGKDWSNSVIPFYMMTNGLVDKKVVEEVLEKYKNRKYIISHVNDFYMQMVGIEEPEDIEL